MVIPLDLDLARIVDEEQNIGPIATKRKKIPQYLLIAEGLEVSGYERTELIPILGAKYEPVLIQSEELADAFATEITRNHNLGDVHISPQIRDMGITTFTEGYDIMIKGNSVGTIWIDLPSLKETPIISARIHENYMPSRKFIEEQRSAFKGTRILVNKF